MPKFIALLRGINVGGHNKLPMKQLREMLTALGLRHVTTYIQSGNVVFETEETDTTALAARMTAAIEKSCDFAPRVMVLDEASWQTAVSKNPFPKATDEPKTLHLYFLEKEPTKPDSKQLIALKKENERFEIIGAVFYLHAPDGIGRSKLAERAERLLDVPATARNWRTVSKLTEMLNDV